MLSGVALLLRQALLDYSKQKLLVALASLGRCLDEAVSVRFLKAQGEEMPVAVDRLGPRPAFSGGCNRCHNPKHRLTMLHGCHFSARQRVAVRHITQW